MDFIYWKEKLSLLRNFFNENRVWIIVGCLIVVATIGSGVYFSKDYVVGVLSSRQKFLGGLFDAVSSDTVTLNPKESQRPIKNTAPTKKCIFETSQAPLNDIIIFNEIAWMGNEESANNEWIEIKNISDEAINLGGWHLVDQSGKINMVFSSNANIESGGFYILERGGSNFLEGIKTDAFFTGAIKNNSEAFRLFNSNCQLMDEVSAIPFWPAGDNIMKKTMERNLDNLDWYTSGVAGGTPKQENTPFLTFETKIETVVRVVPPKETTLPSTATISHPLPINVEINQTPPAQPFVCPSNSSKNLSSVLLINELAWAGTASGKTSQEWIEIKNNSDSVISLEGWQLQNEDHSIKVFFDVSDAIPARGFYVLERGSADFLPGIKANKFFTGAIKNSDEVIKLFDKGCSIVDEIVANIGFDKNWPAGTAGPDYRSAERSEDFSWYTYGTLEVNGILGTPGKQNSSSSTPAVNSGNENQPSVPVIPPVVLQPSPIYYALAVSKLGDGAGSVVSDPFSIACVSTCTGDSKDFISGTLVTLTALAADNSEFTGWSDDCSGTGTCALSMVSNQSAVATFIQTVLPLPSPPPLVSLPSFSTLPIVKSNVDHILISQVQITGGVGQTTNDFIEIYNPTSDQFNVKGYRLVKRTKTSVTDTLIKSWTSDTFVPAYGFYLWANSSYANIAVTPDVTTTSSIADNNGIAIRFGSNDTGSIIDSVAWGSAENAFVEGATYSSNPTVNESLLRRNWQDSCAVASYESAIGNGCDTQNNASDFELSQSSHPRNSQSN